MKKSAIFLIVIALLCTNFIMADAVPGSESDPIITLSYLETKLKEFGEHLKEELSALINQKIDKELNEQIDEKIDAELDEKLDAVDEKLATLVAENKNIPANQTAPYIFETHHYDAGTVIIFGDSTEFIVRRGGGMVIDPLGNNIPDLTDGKDIPVGTIIPQNHHMLNPAADGRGLKVIEGADFWIMIKGPFELK